MVSSSSMTDADAARLSMCRRLIWQERCIDRVLAKHITLQADLAMLLDLYVAPRDGREAYIWEVCAVTSVPVSTASRRLRSLIASDFVRSEKGSRDRRRVTLCLTLKGKALLDRLFDCMSHDR